MTSESDRVNAAVEEMERLFPIGNYTRSHGAAYRHIARIAADYLPAGAKILDFGAGPGDKTAVLQLLGFDCCACDDLRDDWHEGWREKILAFADKLGIDFHLIDGGALPYQPESLDAVMMFDVIEHLHDSPRELLLGLLGLLKPSGCLMLTVPNAVNLRKRIHVAFGRTNYPPFEDYYWYPEHYRGHIREYTKDDLLKLSRYLDLEVLKLCGCDHMLQKIPRPAQPLYLALTSVFAGWKDTWMLVARKPLDWSPNKTCTRVPYAWS